MIRSTLLVAFAVALCQCSSTAATAPGQGGGGAGDDAKGASGASGTSGTLPSARADLADGGGSPIGVTGDGDAATSGGGGSPGLGDTSACAGMAGAAMLAPGTALAGAIAPNPIVSLSKPVQTTTQGFDASLVFRDPANPTQDLNQSWHPDSGESVTIDVGAGYDQLLMVWEIAYPDYTSAGNGFGLPYDYQIDVSADGTTWKSAVARTTSRYKSREAKFAFTGQAKVRFTVPDNKTGTFFTTMKIFDASHGSSDTWIVTGSGPSRAVYDDVVAPGFGHLVNACRPKYYPALMNISDLPGKVGDLVDALKAPPEENWLALNPDFHFWVLNYGMTDTQTGSVGDFSAGLEYAVQLLVAAGRVPIVPRIQYVTPDNGIGFDPAVIAQFNAAIDQLVTKYALLPAPDLYGWFHDKPEELCTAADDNHDPSGFCGESQWNGIQPINLPSRPGVSDTIRLWAAAAIAGGIYAD